MKKHNTRADLEKALLAAQTSEESLKIIFNTSPIPMAMFDTKDENILLWSSSAIEKFGHSPEKVSEWYELAYPDPAYRKEVIERWKPFLEKAHESKKAVNTGEYYITCMDGTVKICEIYAQFIPGNLIVTLNDVTQFRNIQNALLESNSFLDITGRMARVGGWQLDVKTKELSWTKETYRIHEVPFDHKPSLEEAINFFHPDDREKLEEAIEEAMQGKPYDMELKFITAKGNELWTHTICKPFVENGEVVKLTGTFQDITERKNAEKDLKKIEWLLEKEKNPTIKEYLPYYGDVTLLNTERTILDNVGHDILSMLANDIMELLDTSLAVYEKNGDYAFGMFVSGWCQVMDNDSRKLCKTAENAKALVCGKWLCHENCWNESAKAAIATKKSTDIECVGGIRLFAEPIFAGNECIGVINIGYGSPPRDESKLQELADAFHNDISELRKAANNYKDRPPFLIDIAKNRLKSTAAMIGNMVYQKQIEKTLQTRNHELEIFNDAAVDRELMINEHRKQINQLLKELGKKPKYDIVE